MTTHPPLFVANGAAGVTQPVDARLALAGLLTPFAGPLDATAGILAAAGSPGNVTGSSSGPNMKYVVAAGVFATARGTSTDGLYVWANDGSLTIDSGSPAPGSGTRYDLIWARAKNSGDGFGDADSNTQLGVTVGTSGASPSKPYGSVPAGALVLAESLVGTSIANASLATITQVAGKQVARGGVLPCLSTARPSSPYQGQVIFETDTKLAQIYDGSAWQTIAPGPKGLIASSYSSQTDTTSGTTTLATVTPTLVSGRRYKITFAHNGSIITNTTQVIVRCNQAGTEQQRLHTAAAVEAVGTQLGGTFVMFVPGAGSAVNYTLTVQVPSGTGAARSFVGSGLTVEDIGT